MRVFIGIKFSPVLKKNIHRQVERVRPLISRGRFSDWQGYHLTLKFLGETEEQRVAVVSSIIKATDFVVKPFDIRIEGLGYFRNRGGDILWAGIGHDENLETLHQIIESRMVLAGFEPDHRVFKPHLTIARAARFAVPFGEIAARWGEKVLTEKVESIVLFESARIDGQICYVPLMEKKL